MRRRAFLTAAAAVGAAVTFTREGRAASQQKKSDLRLSIQEWIVSGANLNQKVEKMARWGIEGLEVGGKGLAGRVTELKNALKGSGVTVSAVCAGYDGTLGHHEADVRDRAITSIKAILGPVGELGSTGLIFVPALNVHPSKLSAGEVREALLDVLPALGDVAEKAGTRLLLEPVSRNETVYVRRLADAAAIVRDVDHPAVGMMGDFHHMGMEETSDLGAFLSAGPYLHHVHLATTKGRLLPGQAERRYVDGFRALKMIGYHDFCSFECGVRGDRDAEIPASVAFVKNEWQKAEV